MLRSANGKWFLECTQACVQRALPLLTLLAAFKLFSCHCQVHCRKPFRQPTGGLPLLPGSGYRVRGRLPCEWHQSLCGCACASVVQNTDGDRYSQVAHMSVLVCAGLSAFVWVSPCLSVSVCLRLSTSASVCLLLVSACLGLSLSAPVHLCEYVRLFLSLCVCLWLIATLSLPIYHG